MFSAIVVDQPESWPAFTACSLSAISASGWTGFALRNDVVAVQDRLESSTAVNASVNLSWVAHSASVDALDTSFGIDIVNEAWLAHITGVGGTWSACDAVADTLSATVAGSINVSANLA